MGCLPWVFVTQFSSDCLTTVRLCGGLPYAALRCSLALSSICPTNRSEAVRRYGSYTIEQSCYLTSIVYLRHGGERERERGGGGREGENICLLRNYCDATCQLPSSSSNRGVSRRLLLGSERLLPKSANKNTTELKR